LWLACPSTAIATTIPVVALAALNTQEPPLPRESSTEAARNLPSARAMKNQCLEAATARRTGMPLRCATTSELGLGTQPADRHVVDQPLA
jgi:hypothetical protein